MRSPVEWVVACLRALGITAVDANPQWWMEHMGQQLFEPPNVAGWKNNAYWLNSTALWARADFARNLTWQAHEAGFLLEIDRPHAAEPVRDERGARPSTSRSPSSASTPPSARLAVVRSVLVNWLNGQRATEAAPTYRGATGPRSTSPR